MQFSIHQKDLAEQIQVVLKAIPTRSVQPILDCFLISCDATAQKVTLTGFNLSIMIETQFDAQVFDSGATCVPAKLLSDIVSKLPSDVLTVSKGDTEINLKSGRSNFSIRHQDIESYPNFSFNSVQSFDVSSETLRSGFKAVLYGCSTEETKQVLTGVRMSSEADLEFASTNGHLLSKAVFQESLGNIALTIPSKAVKLVLDALSKFKEDTVSVSSDASTIQFQIGNTRIVSRLLEGQYPNYNQLIPNQFLGLFTIHRKAFLDAIKRVSIFTPIIKIDVSHSDQMVLVSSQNNESGNAVESIEVQFSGDDITIAFNANYLESILSSFVTEEIQVNFNRTTSPVVMTPLGGDKVTALLMPVQIRN